MRKTVLALGLVATACSAASEGGGSAGDAVQSGDLAAATVLLDPFASNAVPHVAASDTDYYVSHGRTITRVHVGSDQKIIFVGTDGVDNPRGMVVAADRLYWMNERTNDDGSKAVDIWTADRDGKGATAIAHDVKGYSDLIAADATSVYFVMSGADNRLAVARVDRDPTLWTSVKIVDWLPDDVDNCSVPLPEELVVTDAIYVVAACRLTEGHVVRIDKHGGAANLTGPQEEILGLAADNSNPGGVYYAAYQKWVDKTEIRRIWKDGTATTVLATANGMTDLATDRVTGPDADSPTLYFMDRGPSGQQLSAVSKQGGPTSVVATPVKDDFVPLQMASTGPILFVDTPESRHWIAWLAGSNGAYELQGVAFKMN
jgi:hypothetical protein